MTAITNAPPGTSVRVAAISLGHRRGRELGDLNPLAASIAADGLAHPVVLSTNTRLVSGRRRLAACTLLGWTQIPAVTVTGIWEALELIEAERADGRHAKPLTVAEAMALHGALTSLQWWPRKTPAPYGSGLRASATTGRRNRIAAALGLNSSYYTQARELWEATQGYKQTMSKRHPVSAEDQARAAEAFATIRSPRDIGYAYAQYRGRPDPSQRMKDIRRAASAKPAPVNGRRTPIRTQARAIEAALDTMHGVITGLCGTGELDPAIPASVTARWEDETTRAIRALTSFRKTLKEHQAHASHDNRDNR